MKEELRNKIIILIAGLILGSILTYALLVRFYPKPISKEEITEIVNTISQDKLNQVLEKNPPILEFTGSKLELGDVKRIRELSPSFHFHANEVVIRTHEAIPMNTRSLGTSVINSEIINPSDPDSINAVRIIKID